jgi:hypothetical protein
MVLMLEIMCDRGKADDARRAQVDDAVAALVDAVLLRPGLAEHVRDEPELAPVRRRVLA